MWRGLWAHRVHLRAGAGQERLEVPGAAHTACTIEMANLGARVDVAVIDEIQVHREIPEHPSQYLLWMADETPQRDVVSAPPAETSCWQRKRGASATFASCSLRPPGWRDQAAVTTPHCAISFMSSTCWAYGAGMALETSLLQGLHASHSPENG